MTNTIPAWVEGRLVPVDKIEVHLRGLRHKAVSVFVTCGCKVLAQRRALTKYHTPGLWANTCCTHPRWDESPVDCAVRRLREELGITGLEPVHRGRVEYRADVGSDMTEHERVDLFHAKATPDLAIAPNPHEVMETRWVGLDQLTAEVLACPEQFTPWLRIYLTRHSEQIYGMLKHS